jgi:ABC-type uncharacterized transport system auxiliary subunit
MRSGKRLCLLLVAAACCALVSSCGSAPVKRYYTLDNRMPGVKDASTPPVCALPLTVASVMAASPYEREKIVFRSDQNEIRYYNYRFWVSSPEEMLKSLLAQKLHRSRLFSAVETYVHSSSEHMALYVKVNSIEEIDIGAQWNAHLAMEFLLKSADDDAPLWRYEFDETKPISNQDVLSLIQTLSHIYNEQTDQMLQSLAELVKSSDKCRPRE